MLFVENKTEPTERTATITTMLGMHLPIIVFTHSLDKKFIALLVCKREGDEFTIRTH